MKNQLFFLSSTIWGKKKRENITNNSEVLDSEAAVQLSLESLVHAHTAGSHSSYKHSVSTCKLYLEPVDPNFLSFHNLSHEEWNCLEPDSQRGILFDRKWLFSLPSQTWYARKSMHCPHKSPHFLSIQETVTCSLAPDTLQVSGCLWYCSANQSMFINENKHRNVALSVRHLLSECECWDWIRLRDECSVWWWKTLNLYCLVEWLQNPSSLNVNNVEMWTHLLFFYTVICHFFLFDQTHSTSSANSFSRISLKLPAWEKAQKQDLFSFIIATYKVLLHNYFQESPTQEVLICLWL